MAKKITHDDIAEKNLLAPLVKEFDNVIKKTLEATDVVRGLNKELSNKATIESAKDLERLAEITKRITKVEEKLIILEKEKTRIRTKSIKELKKKQNETKKLNDANKKSIDIDKGIIKEEQKLNKLNSDKIQDLVQLKRLTTEQNKINKDTEILNNKNAGTLEKLAASSRKLRREREKLNLNTKKGQERLKLINKELDKNNKILLKSADSQKKAALAAKGYGGSIKEAAEASGIFGGVLGKLSQVQGVLNALTKKSVVAEEADALAKEQQAVATSQLTLAQRALNTAQAKGVKALKLLKAALISTGIGALVVVLGSLVTFFTRSQDGADALSDQMARLTAVMDVIIDRFSLVGRGLVQIFQGLGNELKQAQIKLKIFLLESAQFEVMGKTINDNSDQVAELNKELDDLVGIEQGLETIRSALRNIGDEIKEDSKAAKILNALTREATREAKLFEAQQSTALTRAKELNLISRDKLKSDQIRIDALKEANKIEVSIAERQLQIQAKLLASSLDAFDAKSGGLKLDAQRLDFINRIRNGEIGVAEAVQKAADFTLSSAKGADALNDIVEKIVAQEQAKQGLLDKQATTIKKLSALQVQVATKNATAKQQEAAFQRELFKDEDLQIEKRIEAIELARDLDVAGNKFRLDANIINEAEFQARKLKLAKQTEEQIQKLLAKTGKSDVDFEAIAKKQAKIVNDIEQELLDQDIKRLERRLEVEKLTIKERIKIQEELFATQQTKLQAQAEFELSLEGKTAEEIELIRLKLSNNVEDNENARVDANKKANEEIEKNEKGSNEKRKQEALKLLNDVSGATIKAIGEQNNAKTQLIDDDISRLQDSIAIQQRIANEGGENILAEEKARLAKRNLERSRELKRQAQQEQAIALALAFVNSFAAYSKDDPKGALRKALVDKFLAQGVASLITGSYYDGVEDTGTVSNPLDSKGGRLTMTHDHERILSSAQNSMIPKGMTNDELAKMAHDYHNGNTWGFMPQISGAGDNTPLVKAIENNAKTIERSLKKYQSHQESELDTMGNFVIYTMRKGIKTIRNVTSPKL